MLSLEFTMFALFRYNKNFDLLHKLARKAPSSNFSHLVAHFCTALHIAISQTAKESDPVLAVRNGPVQVQSKLPDRDRRSGLDVWTGPFLTGAAPVRSSLSGLFRI